MLRFLKALFAYFRFSFVGTGPSSFIAQPGTGAAPTGNAIEANGGLNNIGGIAAFLLAMQANAAPLTGYMNYASIATAATVTLNQATLPGGIGSATILWTGATATAATFDSTQNIINALPGAQVGMTSMMLWANSSTATVTATAGDANTTLSGTTTNITLALRPYQIKVTNLAAPHPTIPNTAHPNSPGAASTNTTTTTAAVAAQTPTATTTTVVIPVTSATGIIANQSVLSVVMSNGLVLNGLVTNISSLNITINLPNLAVGASTFPIASGATVYVWNPKVTITGMFSITGSALTA